MHEKLHKKLKEREEKGTLRSLSFSDGLIDFASNDYLGLSKMEFLLNNSGGSTGSRLISGNSGRIEQAEAKLAEFFGSEAALCFNSGYDANIGVFSSIPQRGDIILYDALIHASVRDGILMSWATSYSFQHNDTEDLARLLQKHAGKCIYIAVEALYSMTGDLCPLGTIAALAEQYNAYLILDEAHSSGVFGEQGRGLAHALNRHSTIFLRVATFGKAYGSHGAVVLTSTEARNYLINFARSFIYTTALPISDYERMAEVVSSQMINEQRVKLQENIRRFRELFHEFEFVSAVNSPIQILRIKSIDLLRKIQEELKKSGFFAKAIFAPTVPQGEECLRFCLHSFNSKKEIEELYRMIQQHLTKNNVTLSHD